jgi:hypothetical protein
MGRRTGSRNKVTQVAQQLASGLVNDQEYLKRLKARLESGKIAPAIEVMLWAYAHGKPKESIELSGPGGGPIVTQIARVIVDRADRDVIDAGD